MRAPVWLVAAAAGGAVRASGLAALHRWALVDPLSAGQRRGPASAGARRSGVWRVLQTSSSESGDSSGWDDDRAGTGDGLITGLRTVLGGTAGAAGQGRPSTWRALIHSTTSAPVALAMTVVTAPAERLKAPVATTVPLPQLLDVDKYNPNTLRFTPKAELERRCTMRHHHSHPPPPLPPPPAALPTLPSKLPACPSLAPQRPARVPRAGGLD